MDCKEARQEKRHEDDLRKCSWCGKHVPLKKISTRRGIPPSTCFKCADFQIDMTKLLNRQLHQMVRMADIKKIEGTLDILVEAAGGVRNLARAWKNYVASGNARETRSASALVNAIAVVDKYKAEKEGAKKSKKKSKGVVAGVDTSKLSEEELKESICTPLRELKAAGMLEMALAHMKEKGEL